MIIDSESTSSSENPHYEFASSIHSDCETLNEPTKAITHGPFKSKRSLVAARSGPLTRYIGYWILHIVVILNFFVSYLFVQLVCYFSNSDDTVGALGTTANIYNHDYDNGLDINENLYETENLVAQVESPWIMSTTNCMITLLTSPHWFHGSKFYIILHSDFYNLYFNLLTIWYLLVDNQA